MSSRTGSLQRKKEEKRDDKQGERGKKEAQSNMNSVSSNISKSFRYTSKTIEIIFSGIGWTRRACMSACTAPDSSKKAACSVVPPEIALARNRREHKKSKKGGVNNKTDDPSRFEHDGRLIILQKNTKMVDKSTLQDTLNLIRCSCRQVSVFFSQSKHTRKHEEEEKTERENTNERAQHPSFLK